MNDTPKEADYAQIELRALAHMADWNRKQAIIAALRAFIEQRPGFDWHNYATARDYRSDQRHATRQLHDARTLLRQVELHDSITADDILREAQSGRLTIKDISAHNRDSSIYHKFSVDYCTGQYWCTEFRAGVCRLLASVLWTWKRDHCMPPPAETKPEVKFTTARGRVSAGDWLRASFRQQFGRPLAGRWFS